MKRRIHDLVPAYPTKQEGSSQIRSPIKRDFDLYTDPWRYVCWRVPALGYPEYCIRGMLATAKGEVVDL